MAVSPFQADILKRMSGGRADGVEGGTYVAGGLALNHVLGLGRLSRDIDVFNDSGDAFRAAYEADTRALRAAGYDVRLLRVAEGFAEAVVTRNGEATDVQWARDSAFRFFRLARDPLLGTTMHPFDLATNKLLALAGRREPRDWVDAVRCTERVQSLGLLAWAACGKDPGYSPPSLVEAVARTRHAQDEIDWAVASLAPLAAAGLSRRWHAQVDEARRWWTVLPPEFAGCCVLDAAGELFRGTPEQGRDALAAGQLRFLRGCIGGNPPGAPLPGPDH